VAKRRKREDQLRAVGITCGVGSMLVGARAAGFKVVGNIEWRKYYAQPDQEGRTTFGENFPGAVYRENVDHLTSDEVEKLMGADIALGHPECGRFSQLDGPNRRKAQDRGLPDRADDAGDIPLFVNLVSKLQPRFFVMDDLPKSFQAFPMSAYHEGLQGYDLFPEWVSNWGYGNVQKARNRMFMLGALKTERFTFVPGEQEHTKTVKDEIGDLAVPGSRRGNVANHDPHDMASDCFRALNLGAYRKKNTWGEVRRHFTNLRTGTTLQYYNVDGKLMSRIGFVKGHWDGPANVLTGGNACLHALRCEPYTIRERARIQGFPDDFVFYGTVLNKRDEWDHDKNQHMVRQTGKAMPVQFCTYVSQQIADHINGIKNESKPTRILQSNEYVSAAKTWYCTEVGYADQKRACGACWLYDRCSIRHEKYKIGEPYVSVSNRDSGVHAGNSPSAVRDRSGAQENPRGRRQADGPNSAAPRRRPDRVRRVDAPIQRGDEPRRQRPVYKTVTPTDYEF
jgi:DNA (cytosine-5)-methyltransferase 1